jgi:thiol-disulfide isomerase/thioredoxin
MADTDQKKARSRTAAIVMVLLLATAILFAIAYLRHGEPGSLPTSLAANGLVIHKTSSEEIQAWIASEMKKSGAKIGVVNIWATWCEPCREEMPEFAKFQKSGLAPVFLISADNEADEPIVRSFLIEKGVAFESSLIAGDQQKFVEKWQSLSSPDPSKQWSMSLPATFLVDAAGKVQSFTIGGITEPELSGLVKNALDTAHD